MDNFNTASASTSKTESTSNQQQLSKMSSTSKSTTQKDGKDGKRLDLKQSLIDYFLTKRRSRTSTQTGRRSTVAIPAAAA